MREPSHISFKALVYNGFYVNEALLQRGIYEVDTPTLHQLGTTIGDMINTANNYSLNEL